MEIAAVQRVGAVPATAEAALSPQEQARNRELVSAIQTVNRSGMLGQDAELTFQRDRDTNRLVIQLVDPKTKEVIRQIPPEYILRASEQLFSKQAKDKLE